MAYDYERSDDFIRRLYLSLGLDPDRQMIRKLVIEVSVDSPVLVYVQRYLDTERDGDLPALLAEHDRPHVIEARDVRVSDRGDVEAR